MFVRRREAALAGTAGLQKYPRLRDKDCEIFLQQRDWRTGNINNQMIFYPQFTRRSVRFDSAVNLFARSLDKGVNGEISKSCNAHRLKYSCAAPFHSCPMKYRCLSCRFFSGTWRTGYVCIGNKPKATADRRFCDIGLRGNVLLCYGVFTGKF